MHHHAQHVEKRKKSHITSREDVMLEIPPHGDSRDTQAKPSTLSQFAKTSKRFTRPLIT